MSDYDGSMESWGTDDDQATFSGNPFENQFGYENTFDSGVPKPVIGSETPGELGYISGINTGAFDPQYGTSQGGPTFPSFTNVSPNISKVAAKTQSKGPSPKNIGEKGTAEDGIFRALMGFLAYKSMKKQKDEMQEWSQGHRGGVPKFTASRTQLPQPEYVPYSGKATMGKEYFSPVTYTPKAAEGGIMGLAAGGLRDGAFVIPADVVSHFGNGSSEAGLKFLAKKLGATPIKGKGDGMSDSIDTTIEGQQPAKVAHEEAIVSPEKVAALGKGNAKKGAKVLYAMMDRVRKARTGTKKQGKQINPNKFAPGGIAGYAGGGAVSFNAGGIPTTTAGSATTTNLSSWAGPGITNYIAKGTALAEAPAPVYTGALTAGTSPLQQQALTGYQNLQAPAALGQAAQTAGNVAAKAGTMGYSPVAFGSQYSAPAQYQAGQFANQFQGPAAYQTGQFANQYTGTGAYTPTTATSGFNAPGAYQGVDFTAGITPQTYQAGQFANQFQGPGAYQAGQFDTGLGGLKSVEGYMTPYLQGVTGIEAREARRQSEIDRIAAASRLAQAGGYGGSRQAIMEAEGARNLQTQIGDIQAKGLQSAFDRAQAQRLAESGLGLQAQSAGEASRQFGAGQAMTAAQQAAQYGSEAQRMGEASRQFGATQGMQGLQMLLDARKAAEASRQFGAGQAMTGAQTAAQLGLQAQQQTAQERQFGAQQQATADQLRAQYGSEAQRAAEASRQFGSQQAMTAAQQMAQYGSEAQRAAEASRQFGAQQGLTSAQAAAQYGLAGQQATEQSRQYGARFGLDALGTQLQAAQAQGQLGVQQGQLGLQNLAAQMAAGTSQRGIEQEGLAAAKAQFEQQQQRPFDMINFQKSLYSGLPVSAATNVAQTTDFQDIAGLMRDIFGVTPAGGATTP